MCPIQQSSVEDAPKEPGRTAFEARFADLEPKHTCWWEDVSDNDKSIWAKVEAAVLDQQRQRASYSYARAVADSALLTVRYLEDTPANYMARASLAEAARVIDALLDRQRWPGTLPVLGPVGGTVSASFPTMWPNGLIGRCPDCEAERELPEFATSKRRCGICGGQGVTHAGTCSACDGAGAVVANV